VNDNKHPNNSINHSQKHRDAIKKKPNVEKQKLKTKRKISRP
jgi:hypothetical protein